MTGNDKGIAAGEAAVRASALQAEITAELDDAFQFSGEHGIPAHGYVTRAWIEALIRRATTLGGLLEKSGN
jgi:hypothetical protein